MTSDLDTLCARLFDPRRAPSGVELSMTPGSRAIDLFLLLLRILGEGLRLSWAREDRLAYVASRMLTMGVRCLFDPPDSAGASRVATSVEIDARPAQAASSRDCTTVGAMHALLLWRTAWSNPVRPTRVAFDLFHHTGDLPCHHPRLNPPVRGA
jgi:hypothetical protein